MTPENGIYELRRYQLKPGMRDAYLDLLLPRLAFYRATMGPCVSHMVGEDGADVVITLWHYESHEDRNQRRSKLDEDADWATFRSQVRPMIEQLESTFLTSTPGSEPVWL